MSEEMFKVAYITLHYVVTLSLQNVVIGTYFGHSSFRIIFKASLWKKNHVMLVCKKTNIFSYMVTGFKKNNFHVSVSAKKTLALYC